jgi:hypothetical protein
MAAMTITDWIAIIIGIAGVLLNVLRTPHQNRVDDGGYVKNMADTADLSTGARLKAEQRAAELDKRIAELEKQLHGMAYRVTFVVKTGDAPSVENITVARFPDRRVVDKGHSPERREE